MASNAVGLPLEYASSAYRASLKSGHKKPNNKHEAATTILWRPHDPEAVPMSRYRHRINRKFGLSLKTSHELHRWSVENPHEFWIDLYEYCDIVPALPPETKFAYDPRAKFRDIPTWFPGLRLNFAENLLVRNTARSPDAIALTGLREGQLDDPEHISWAELSELVRITRSALLRNGIKKSDVIAGLMSNSIWIIIVFLASASIGAIFTSIAPDMGLSGCLSRLSQVNPKYVFCDIDYAVRGTRRSLTTKVLQIQRALKEKSPKVVFVPTTHKAHLKRNIDYIKPLGMSLHDYLSSARASDKLEFRRLPTSHPLVIVYSSGTTGQPKCIVSPHMSILNYKKIAYLHNSLGPHSVVFQYSSTSWILWNVMMGHLSAGARLITFDGNPLWPDAGTPLRIIQRYDATYWGTSPRYLLELEQSSIDPARDFDLGALRMVTCTGATLTGSQMRWFYTAFPKSIHLSSVAGGTDIASSWIASDPAGPIHENEMQMWALGHDCDILDPDSTDDSAAPQSIAHTSRAGELVCWRPIPSAPSAFWNDPGHKKYHEAYFERFPLATTNNKHGRQGYLDVWAQHDFTTRNPDTGGLQILGRSDGVLNPSGIRFGSSEIYNIVESHPFNTLISDSLCVGRRRPSDKDETVFLFLTPAKGVTIDDKLVSDVKAAISRGLSARHVPKFVFEVNAIPYTINGKKVETPVKKILSGIDVKPSSTIVNPAALEEYKQFANVERETTRAKL